MPTEPCTICGKRCRRCQVCHVTEAGFGPPGGQPTRCKKDKGPNDIKFIKAGSVCQHPNCVKQKAYGPLGGPKVHCGTHAEEGEYNLNEVYCEKCSAAGTVTIAGFGTDGGKPSRCSKHREEDHIDLKNKKCERCKKVTASYTHEGKTRFCAGCCKGQGLPLRNGKIGYCIVCDNTIATFGLTSPQYCKTCRDKEALDPRVYKDVRSQKCTSCSKGQAAWGQTGGRYERCGSCAQPTDVLLKGGCERCHKSRSRYGNEGVALRCRECKLDSDVDVYVTYHCCRSCGLEFATVPNGVCTYCDDHSRLDRTYEKQFAIFVKEVFSTHPRVEDIRFNSNRGIGKECGSRRPDILLDAGTFYIDIEIDENQHKPGVYRTPCELNRSDNISEALGLPVVFIRINPNSYRSATGLQIDTPISDRKKKLQETLEKILEDQYRDPEIVYLFFDETPAQQRASEAEKVAAFNLAGMCVGKFPSIGQAARYLESNHENIRRAVNDANRTSCGYRWKPVSAEEYETLTVVDQIVPWKGQRGSRVKMIDPATKTTLAVFESHAVAAKTLGLTRASITSAVDKKRKSSGYVWVTANDDELVEQATQEANVEQAKKQKRFK